MNTDTSAIVRAAFQQLDSIVLFWIVALTLTVAGVIIFAPKGRKPKRRKQL